MLRDLRDKRVLITGSSTGIAMRPARRTACESVIAPAPATLYVPGWCSVTERCRISRASSMWMNCKRGSRPNTVGTNGCEK